MQLSEALDMVDGQVELLSLALSGQENAPPHEMATERLRDCMVAFSGLAQKFRKEDFTPPIIERMQQISQKIALQREFLVRMGAITAQQVQALVPQHKDVHTYGGVAASGPQGGRASVSKIYHISG